MRNTCSARKKGQRDHKRDIIPSCIISYSYFFGLVYYLLAMHTYIPRRKFLGVIRGGGGGGEYKLTFAI